MAEVKEQQDKPKVGSDAVRWVYEKDNEWVDYDKETTEQLENKLLATLRNKNTKGQRVALQAKLNKGPIFGTEENENKYSVIINLDGRCDPPVIQKSFQRLTRSSGKELINVTRFPNKYDMYNDREYLYDLENYQCKYKWYYKLDENDETNDENKDSNLTNDGDNRYKEYDLITSKQIEMALNKLETMLVLNKGEFASPKKKNLCSIKFNHHSIPSEATQHEMVEPKKDIQREIKYELIEIKDDELKFEKTVTDDDEIMSMIMATKHFMRPLSMRYWMQQRELDPNNPLKCIICYDEFSDENFLEYWVSRKLQKKHSEETEIISSKCIAIQLCACAGDHFFHAECVAQYLAPKKKCPLCGVKYGVEVGTQPDGIMTVRMVKDVDVASTRKNENKNKGSIEIKHKFNSGIQIKGHQNPGQRYSSRTEYIYLPRTPQGMQILGMIRLGWKRRMLYTVGRSVTRSLDNVIIFNGIHFKTSRYGGPTNYGYPDQYYFQRVKDEFNQKGININDIEDKYKPRRRKPVAKK